MSAQWPKANAWPNSTGELKSPDQALGKMQWRKVQKATKYPTLIYEETSRAVGLLRDLFNPSFENIHVNDEAVYNEIKDYVTLIAPDRANIVKLYKGQLPHLRQFRYHQTD